MMIAAWRGACLGAALLACGLSTAAWAQCEAKPGALRAQGREAVVLFQPRPAPIKVGELFALDMVVCSKHGEARALAVDATMPEHKHGMNYKPVVKRAAAGSTGGFAVTGFILHMPGRWQFVFDIETSAGRERVLHDLTLE